MVPDFTILWGLLKGSSVKRVCIVLDHIVDPPDDPTGVNVLERKKGCSRDALHSFDYMLERLFLHSAVSKPDSDRAGDDTLFCGRIEVEVAQLPQENIFLCAL